MVGKYHPITTVVKVDLLLSSTEGSTSGCNESATAGHLNGMTKKACATFILSLPEIELQL